MRDCNLYYGSIFYIVCQNVFLLDSAAQQGSTAPNPADACEVAVLHRDQTNIVLYNSSLYENSSTHIMINGGNVIVESGVYEGSYMARKEKC